MSFANPAALWLLPLALLVLLARRRRPARRIRVAALHLWDTTASRDTTPLARQVRRHWLLLLQAAIVVLMVLAIARPMWAARESYAAVVIDTSLSMSARTNGVARLDAARQRAAAWSQTLPSGARIHLITTSPAPRLIGQFAPSDPALTQALAGLTTTSAAANLDAAVEYAVRSDPRPDRVLVVTDGTPAQDRRAEWITVGSPASNLAVTVLSARRLTAAPRDVELVAEVWNYGATPATTALSLTHAGVSLLDRSLTLAPHAGARVVAPLHDITGIVTARIDADDAIAADNVRQTVVAPPPVTRVVLEGGNYFVERALRSRAGVELVAGAGAEPPDVVVCGGCTAVPRALPDAGVLLVSPSAGDAASPALLVQYAENHPVAQAVDLGGIEATVVPGATPATAGTILATGGGLPAIVAYELDGRRVVELRLDLDRSPLALTPAFPVLMANAVDWLAGRDRQAAEYTAGDPIVRAVPRGVETASIVGPNQEVAATLAGGRRLTLADTSVAGTYSVRAGAIAEPFVVNPATRDESDVSLARAARGDIPGRDSAAPAASPVGRDLAATVLAIALLLLAAESWFRGAPGNARRINPGERA